MKLRSTKSVVLLIGVAVAIAGGVVLALYLRHPVDIIEAAKAGSLVGVRLCLEREPASIRAHDRDGMTALHWAAWRGHESIVEYLLDAGANVDDMGPTQSPLHFACRGPNLAVATMLCDHGADVNARGTMGTTPLMWAALNGHRRIIGLLITHGADVNMADDRGDTALYEAVRSESLETVKALIDAGASVNKGEEAISSALHRASGAGDAEMVSLLLKAGADVNAEASGGSSPLCYAVQNRQTEVCRLLIQAGADPNVRCLFSDLRLPEFCRKEGLTDIQAILEAAVQERRR